MEVGRFVNMQIQWLYDMFDKSFDCYILGVYYTMDFVTYCKDLWMLKWRDGTVTSSGVITMKIAVFSLTFRRCENRITKLLLTIGDNKMNPIYRSTFVTIWRIWSRNCFSFSSLLYWKARLTYYYFCYNHKSSEKEVSERIQG